MIGSIHAIHIVMALCIIVPICATTAFGFVLWHRWGMENISREDARKRRYDDSLLTLYERQGVPRRAGGGIG